MSKPTEQQAIPYARFKQVNDQLAQARAEIDRLTSHAGELQSALVQREHSTVERIAQADRRADAASTHALKAEQAAHAVAVKSWVRDVSRASRFVRPDDALDFLDLVAITTPAEAEQQVRDLPARKPYLIEPRHSAHLADLLTPMEPAPATPEGDTQTMLNPIRQAQNQPPDPLAPGAA